MDRPNPLASGAFAQARRESMIVTADQARVYNMGIGEARILIDSERSGGEYWLGKFREDPGVVTTLHVHRHFDEQFYVLDGILSLFLKGKWTDLRPGALAVVPRGIPHAQGNHGKVPVHVLGAGEPAGFERLFPAIDELLSRVPATDPNFMSEFSKLARSYDMDMVGPPPPRP